VLYDVLHSVAMCVSLWLTSFFLYSVVMYIGTMFS